MKRGEGANEEDRAWEIMKRLNEVYRKERKMAKYF